MLAQRLQILLGHSTFLQAFQHSGASPRRPLDQDCLIIAPCPWHL